MTERIICNDNGGELREVIVRCFDCIWFDNNPRVGAYCRRFGSGLCDDYDGFCAWVERRSDD